MSCGELNNRAPTPRQLAREAGLASWALSEQDMRFPVPQLARLWQVSVAKLTDPRLGVHVAELWTHGSCRLSDYLFDSASTLGEAISLTLDYTPLVNSAGINDVGIGDVGIGDVGIGDGDGGGGTVRYQVRSPDPVVNSVGTEYALATILQRARHATGRPVAPVRVRFATAAPPKHGELVRAFGTSRIDFGADVSAMTFSRADLDLPLVRVLRAQADALLEMPERTPRWIQRFRQVLAECADDQDLLLGSAARRLMVSPRTLQRMLEQEGTTWRAEVDAARRERAMALLAEGVSKTWAAPRLGYSDAQGAAPRPAPLLRR